MNAPLALTRLHINRLDVPTQWAKLLAGRLAVEAAVPTLIEEPVWLPDGSREYSLRKHPVAPRGSG